MECIVITEVPPCFYEELMVDLLKGQIHKGKAPELDIGCVTVLWGLWVVRQWWDVGGERCYLFLVRQPRFRLGSRCKSQAEWMGVSSCSNITDCDDAIAPHPSCSFRATAARRQSQVDDEADLKNKTVFYRRWNTVETIFSSPVFHSQRST